MKLFRYNEDTVTYQFLRRLIETNMNIRMVEGIIRIWMKLLNVAIKYERRKRRTVFPLYAELILLKKQAENLLN